MTIEECRPGRFVRWISNKYRHPVVLIVNWSETRVQISVELPGGRFRLTWVQPQNLDKLPEGYQP